jgi:hypothetical protein
MSTTRHGSARKATPVAALLAVVAVLIQALIPAAALATGDRGATVMELCTAQGAQTVVIGADGKAKPYAPAEGFAGLPCADCLSATLAVAFAAPALSVAPARYVRLPPPAAEPQLPASPCARGPPRPPGQAPPSLTI